MTRPRKVSTCPRRSAWATPAATWPSPPVRKLHGDVQIDWLAQDPVTRALATAGERVHPASAHLASESAHVEAEAGEHDLNAFQAIRRMDEILLANFTVLQDAVDSGDYDLVAADEAWDLDYFWHENPGAQAGRLVWMTTSWAGCQRPEAARTKPG